MTYTNIRAMECDADCCDERALVTEFDEEGEPRFTHLSRGWFEIEHRAPDGLAITKTHYCPDCAEQQDLSDLTS